MMKSFLRRGRRDAYFYIGEMSLITAKKCLVGEDGDCRSAALFVDEGNPDRIKIFSEDSL